MDTLTGLLQATLDLIEDRATRPRQTPEFEITPSDPKIMFVVIELPPPGPAQNLLRKIIATGRSEGVVVIGPRKELESGS